MNEIWKPVAGFEDRYEVSSEGRVRSFVRYPEGKILRFNAGGKNIYPSLSLGRNNVRTVHSLVARAFLGPKPVSCEVCHEDGNYRNNKASNLYWGTHSENIRDAVRHGTHKVPKTILRGEQNGGTTLSEDQAIKIICDQRIHAQIALDFGVCKMTVGNIKRGKTWQHLWGLSA